ncbi:hypothetical protein [Bacillus thuringiensis]|uniref:hypothetical protein n=1 Tax=Bacillus thuringiensis TaxID=1428 RepID=UPI0015CF2115|nr:hypothetical protein [Bacillus thuringiensis]
MHSKRRDNHDQYLMVAQVKALVKNTAEKESLTEEQVRQSFLKGYKKMFKGSEGQ